MLQILKWAYKRGVLAERARIKQELIRYEQDNSALLSRRPRMEDSENEKDLKRQWRNYEVAREAMDIVIGLLSPRPVHTNEYTPAPIDGGSIDPRMP